MVDDVRIAAPVGAPGPASAPPEPRPVVRFGLLFGAVAGLVALMQVAVSVVSALENRYTLTNLYFSASGGADAQASALLGVFRLLLAAYGSALAGFVFTQVLCWHAGRAAALETGRAAAGTEAGLLVAVTGSLIWVVASLAAVLLFHTDGSLAGVVTASARLSSATDAREVAILLSQETVAILLGLGTAALVGLLAGGSAVARLRRSRFVPTLHPGAYAPAAWPPMVAPYPTAGQPPQA
jgi:hypothetical protein